MPCYDALVRRGLVEAYGGVIDGTNLAVPSTTAADGTAESKGSLPLVQISSSLLFGMNDTHARTPNVFRAQLENDHDRRARPIARCGIHPRLTSPRQS